MNLRKTNKFWKEELDRAFENEEDPELKPDIKININTVAQLDELLEIGEENDYPFHVRELEFCPSENREEEDGGHLDEYWTKVIQLMERCGHQVHRISLKFPGTFVFEDVLIRILRATRNVRCLEIFGAATLYDPFPIEARVVPLRHYFRNNSHQLPQLPCLQYLSLTSASVCWTGPLLHKLVAHPEKLKALSLKSINWSQPSVEVTFALRTFTNLKRLEIQGIFAEVLQYLGTVAMAPQPPLKRIELCIKEDVPRDYPQIHARGVRSIVQELDNFGSLTTFTLQLDGTLDDEGLDQVLPMPGVRLPKLQSIHLNNVFSDIFPLVFRIDAPLKTLKVDTFEPFSWQVFYSSLAHFGSTLEELTVHIEDYFRSFDSSLRMDADDYHALTINLPNLRVIQLHNIGPETLEPLFHLSLLNKLESFDVEFGYCSLNESNSAFELVNQNLNANPSVWQVMPSLRRFSVGVPVRNDGGRQVKKQVVSCVRGETVQTRVCDYLLW